GELQLVEGQLERGPDNAARLADEMARAANEAAKLARSQAIDLRLSVRPDEALAKRLSEIDQLARANPDVITPQIRSELFIDEAKRVQDASRETVDVVGNLFEGMATSMER